MFTRIRTLALAAYVAATLRIGSAYTRAVDLIPVSVDRTVGDLSAVVRKLDRAIVQQDNIAAFEVEQQEASYAREDAAILAGERAKRVRDRINALLA